MPRPALLAISALGLAIAVYAAVASPNAQPADASFHLMRVHAVMRGANLDTHNQYVELRMASGGQTQVSGHDICFFDPSGDPWARFTFPANASSGAAGSSILIGSPSMDALWPHAPDFVFGPANTIGFDLAADLDNPVYEADWSGKVAFGSDSATDPADMCGTQFNVIDSIAYGTTYSGPVDFGTKLASDAPIAGQFAVKLTGAPCNPCARDNAVDYSVVDVTDPANYPRNNAGQTGPLSRQVRQGDVNCDDAFNAVDALFILRAVAQIPPPAACLDDAGDVNCDGAKTAVDALGVLRFVAGLPVNQREPCPDISMPV